MNMFNLTPLIYTLIFPLISMAFFTLLERKFLSYSQNRKGPNKPSFLGLFQPIFDAMKLISKTMIFPFFSNKFLMMFSPYMTILLS